jgi:DNA-binding protein Fis
VGSNGEIEKLALASASAQEMEKKMLQEALQRAGGNISEASRLLKITRNRCGIAWRNTNSNRTLKQAPIFVLGSTQSST